MQPTPHQPTLAEAATFFVASLPSDQKESHQQAVHRFVRWCGATRRMDGLTPHDVGAYADILETSGGASDQAVEPLKAFFSHAKKQGWTAANLGVHLRPKKSAAKASLAREQGRLGDQAQQTIQLTPEGYAKLQEELEELLLRRPHIAEELRRAAADKDFRENAPLDAAKDYQAQVEARIRELESILGAAVVLQARERSASRVRLGSTVVVRDLGYDEVVQYTLVSASEVDLSKGKISVASPTGKALLERGEGDVVEVQAPAGRVRYRIERIVS